MTLNRFKFTSCDIDIVYYLVSWRIHSSCCAYDREMEGEACARGWGLGRVQQMSRLIISEFHLNNINQKRTFMPRSVMLFLSKLPQNLQERVNNELFQTFSWLHLFTNNVFPSIPTFEVHRVKGSKNLWFSKSYIFHPFQALYCRARCADYKKVSYVGVGPRKVGLKRAKLPLASAK